MQTATFLQASVPDEKEVSYGPESIITETDDLKTKFKKLDKIFKENQERKAELKIIHWLRSVTEKDIWSTTMVEWADFFLKYPNHSFFKTDKGNDIPINKEVIESLIFLKNQYATHHAIMVDEKKVVLNNDVRYTYKQPDLYTQVTQCLEFEIERANKQGNIDLANDIQQQLEKSDKWKKKIYAKNDIEISSWAAKVGEKDSGKKVQL